jgi:hypothetical protein
MVALGGVGEGRNLESYLIAALHQTHHPAPVLVIVNFVLEVEDGFPLPQVPPLSLDISSPHVEIWNCEVAMHDRHRI